MFVWGKIRVSFTQMIAMVFAIIILAGTLLLLLPVANKGGNRLSFTEALFTSASAACVTGLVVRDTYTQFTIFGQFVILFLIQVGGLGFMTAAVLFSMMLGRKIGLKERGLLMESTNTPEIGGVVRLFKRVMVLALVCEGIGAVLLSLRFCPRMGFWTGIYYGLFHSVSAFCNAGFDLMGRFEPYTSFVPYQSDALVNIVTMALILLGGLGFIVLNDVIEKKHKASRYKLHTKIVLFITTILIIVGAILFYLLEKDNTLAGLPAGTKILASLFQSITPRTAGFNTIDIAELTEGGSFLMMILMFIGASPGSTGGGIKTTTLLVMMLSAIAFIKNTTDLNIFRRRLDNQIIRRAYCSVTIYAVLAAAGGLLLLGQQGMPIKDALFETLSAIGTVGLTTGATRGLNEFSKIIVIILMYCGRVGSLTMAMALMLRPTSSQLKNPEEKITIG